VGALCSTDVARVVAGDWASPPPRSSHLAGRVSGRFPKSMRLRKRREFLAVQNAGTTLRSRYFLVLVKHEGSGRLGITVSKKVGTAVVRNRVKRAVREFVRTSLRESGEPWVGAQKDVVVIGRPSAAHASTGELWQDLERHRPEVSRC